MIRNLHQKILLHAGILLQDLAIPHERRIRQSTVRPYLAGLFTLPFFFITNYLFNHQRLLLSFLPEGMPMYYFGVILPFGTLLPSLALGWIIREADGEAHLFGATLKVRDFRMMFFTAIAGIILSIIPVGWVVLSNPSELLNGVRLSIWLFMMSLAEVLLCIGAVFHATQWLMLQWLPGRNRIFIRTGIAMLVSAIIFALIHVSYPAPWNSWEMMPVLVPAGILMALAYALTRSLAATVVFNNVIGVASYMLTGVVFSGSATLGLVFDGISAFAVVTIVMLIGIYDEEF